MESVPKFNDRKAKLIGIPLLTMVIPFLATGWDCISTWDKFIHEISFKFVFVVFLWEGNSAVFWYINKRFPGYEQTKKLIKYLIIGTYTYTLVGFTIIKLFLTLIVQVEALYPFQWEIYFNGLRTSIIASTIVCVIYESIHFFILWKEAMLEAEKLKKAGIQSQLDALKAQINPHFMFNSLTTLASLIPEDPDKAVGFVEQLAKQYRYILNMQDKELVPLTEELEFLDSFIFLSKARFGNKIEVAKKISPENHHLYIPPITLQLLVENAIKHNVISKSKHLLITIESKLVNGIPHISVINPLQPKINDSNGNGKGLKNITKRYELLDMSPPMILKKETEYEVTVPLIEINAYESMDN